MRSSIRRKSRLNAPIIPGRRCQGMKKLMTRKILMKSLSKKPGLKFGDSMAIGQFDSLTRLCLLWSIETFDSKHKPRSWKYSSRQRLIDPGDPALHLQKLNFSFHLLALPSVRSRNLKDAHEQESPHSCSQHLRSVCGVAECGCDFSREPAFCRHLIG